MWHTCTASSPCDAVQQSTPCSSQPQCLPIPQQTCQTRSTAGEHASASILAWMQPSCGQLGCLMPTQAAALGPSCHLQDCRHRGIRIPEGAWRLALQLLEAAFNIKMPDNAEQSKPTCHL